MAFPILGTPKPAFFDSSGSPLASGTLTIVEPSTDVNKATYPTYDDAEALTNANANPLTLDARGEPASGLWGVDGEDYKITLKDSDGNTIWTVDDIFLQLGYPRTADEIGAGITPAALIGFAAGEPNNTDRYDTGSARNAAINAAVSVLQQGTGGEIRVGPGTSSDAQVTLAANQSILLSGQTAATRLTYTGGHALIVPSGTGDNAIQNIWIDNLDSGTGLYDAINLAGGETRLTNVDIDFADRYGVYIDAFLTTGVGLRFQGGDTSSLHIAANGLHSTFTNCEFGNIPGKGIECLSKFCAFSNMVFDNPATTCLDMQGNFNTVSGLVIENQTADDAILWSGANGRLQAVLNDVPARGALISGNGNTLDLNVTAALVSTAVEITGNVNQGVIRTGGTSGDHALDIQGAGNTFDVQLNAAANDELEINAADNSVSGRVQGSVNLTTLALDCTLDLVVDGTTTVAAQGCSVRGTYHDNVTVSGAFCVLDLWVKEPTTGVVVSGNAAAINGVVKDGTIAWQIDGNGCSGNISSTSASDHGVLVNGSNNALNVRVTSSTNAAVEITGDNNTITGMIDGDLTLTAASQNNLIVAVVTGTITDNGTGNDTTNTT